MLYKQKKKKVIFSGFSTLDKIEWDKGLIVSNKSFTAEIKNYLGVQKL